MKYSIIIPFIGFLFFQKSLSIIIYFGDALRKIPEKTSPTYLPAAVASSKFLTSDGTIVVDILTSIFVKHVHFNI